MRNKFGLILFLASFVAVFLITAHLLRVEYWLSPPNEKFQQSWREDIQLLEKSKNLPAQWQEIGEVYLRSDNSPAQEWITTKANPIKTNSKGKYKLDVFVIHWIEGYRYGAIVQYSLVDLTTDNTIWELGRTFKLGIVY